MKVLFCGEELYYSYVYTAEALQDDHSIQVRFVARSDRFCDPSYALLLRVTLILFQVMRCPQSEVRNHIHEADVAVPLMCKLDAQLLRTAQRLKLIIQYGVGVEGIDIPMV